MTEAARTHPRFRLALRIYFVSAATVLVTLLALYTVMTTTRRYYVPHDGAALDAAQFTALQLRAQWPDPERMGETLRALHDSFHRSGTLFRWDGSVAASTAQPPLAALAKDDLEQLKHLGRLELHNRCVGETCQIATRVNGSDDAEPPGYLIIEIGPPPRHGSWWSAPEGAEPPPPREHREPPPPERAHAQEDEFAQSTPHDASPPQDRPAPRGPPLALGPSFSLLKLPLTLLLLIGLGVAAALLGRSIARPLERLTSAVRAFGQGDLKARTGLNRYDELGEVARAFDDMAERIGALLRTQTELLANVAHELRTPLARIRVALDLAEQDDADAAVARDSLKEIAEDLSELEQLVDDILASARMDLARSTATDNATPLHLAPVSAESILRGATERFRHRHPTREIQMAIDPDLPILYGDKILLRRALDNLIDNARKYSPSTTAIRLTATSRADRIVIEVIDAGDGISPEDLKRLFTPFFRTDKSRARATGGVGLGLSLSRRIAEAHGGSLTAQSTRGVGTTMTMTLPTQPTST